MDTKSCRSLDRRLWQRFSAKYPAKLKDSRSTFGERLVLRDVSASGIRLVSQEKFFFNDSVALEIQLPDGYRPMNVKGEIVWLRSIKPNIWDIGLHFYKTDLIHSRRLCLIIIFTPTYRI